MPSFVGFAQHQRKTRLTVSTTLMETDADFYGLAVLYFVSQVCVPNAHEEQMQRLKDKNNILYG